MTESRVKIIYVISNIDKALAFEWINDYLDKKSFEITFVLIGKKNTALFRYLSNSHTAVYELPYSGKKDFIKTFLRLFSLLFNIKPHIVHTHLFEANLMGLTTAWLLRIKKRIYTRHHATIHYKEFPSGLKWDKWCNRIATDIVAISNNVREILIDWDKANPKKVHLIHHGFDFNYFHQVSQHDVDALRLKYNLNDSAYPVIGVVSRYMEWKGVHFIIRAFQELRRQYPKAHLVLANAHGDYKDQIQKLLAELQMSSYTEIYFENNLAVLYRLFHVFVHTPINKRCEAFGQTYVESLAIGVPAVFTLSGIACDFIQNGKNALVADYQDSESILIQIKEILSDEDLKNRLIKEGRNSAEQFRLEEMIVKLETLYLS